MTIAAAPAPGLWTRVRRLLEMIKFSHTIFALPFAILSAVLAAEGWPAPRVFGWILAAMVGARSAAMTFNRLLDREFDARNPRTAGRHLVTGEVTPRAAWLFFAVMTGLFVLAAGMLNRVALMLSPVALLVIFGYSGLKRVTVLCHFGLGLGLALAPLGAWVALRGTLEPVPLLLGTVVLFWTAGFDILYACQDVESDRREGLRSIPARFGVPVALRAAAALHAVAALGLLALLATPAGGTGLAVAVAAVIGLMIYEHRLVRPDDLSRVNQAFFVVNGVISVLLLGGVLADVLWL